MKKYISVLLCAATAFSTAIALVGCGEEDNSLVASTVSVEETTEAAKMDISEQTDLSKLYSINYEGDEFAGAWQITEGEGSKFKSFVFVFNGSKKAYLVIGTTGYIENYKIETKTDESGNTAQTFTSEMMFGINGTYTYKFSEDKNSVVLTNTENNKTTTMQKLASFSYIPIPDPEPVIDEELLGAWADDQGEYYYFDKSGIMYTSNNSLTFTFSKYSAKDGKVNSTYTTTGEETITTDYSIKDDTLTFGDYTYNRISADDLK